MLLLNCCTRVLLYAKMLKETELKKQVFFVTFLLLVAFRLGGGLGPSLATPMSQRGYKLQLLLLLQDLHRLGKI